jgi:carboxylesterase
MKKKKISVLILIFVLIISILLHIFTGIFSSYDEINKRDLEYWNYTNKGVIEGTRGFEINGSKDVCWLLVHSYCSTPLEMRELSLNISKDYGNYVKVIRLKGHGEVPSKIVNLSLEDWYEQVNSEYKNIRNECERVNVLGSSYGGTIALNLAKEHFNDEKFNHLYIINGYLGVGYKWYYVLNPKYYLEWFSDSLKYVKKPEIALINSEKGKSEHVAYWNMPLKTLKNSMDFIEKSKENVSSIDVPVLFLHSKNDGVADYELIKDVYSRINSTSKEILYFDESNHILLMDYNKSDVIGSILEYEKELRNN